MLYFKGKYNKKTQLFENLTQEEADELWSLCIYAKSGHVPINHCAFAEYIRGINQEDVAQTTDALFYSTAFTQTALYSIIVHMKESKND